jgi:FkbM family methyltransferase
MPARKSLRRLARTFGLDVRRVKPDDIDVRRVQLIHAAGVRLVLDVGANDGQYGHTLRESGYKDAIISFEPLADAFERLRVHSVGDSAWESHNVALGECDGIETLHVAGNSWSSSMLPMEERHLQSAPESAYVGDVQVHVSSLDSLFPDHLAAAGPAYLKLDVQGFEMAVLRGAEACLARVPLIEIELSVVPLYEGQALYREALDHLGSRGFDLVALWEEMVDPVTGTLLQFDAIVSRAAARSA